MWLKVKCEIPYIKLKHSNVSFRLITESGSFLSGKLLTPVTANLLKTDIGEYFLHFLSPFLQQDAHVSVTKNTNNLQIL